MERARESKYIEQACEFLCTIDDPLVCYNFPYQRNCCKRGKKVSTVKLHHQREFCLSSKHIDCVMYQQEDPRFLPREIAGGIRKNKKRLHFFLRAVGLFFLIVFVIIKFYGVDKDQPVLNQVAQNSDTPFATISSVPSSTLQITDIAEGTLTKSTLIQENPLLQSPARVTSTIGPGFSTPFGVNKKYVVHQIHRGESLRYIADFYGVPLDSLRGINSLSEGYPIWVDQIIVVQLGVTTGPYEKLNAIQLQEDAPIELIAEQYFTTVEKLIDLNDLGDSEVIPAGRWLIVPNY